MKSIARHFILWAALFATLLPVTAKAQRNHRHPQSGIVGKVDGGIIIATPTGELSMIIPDHVRVYSDKGTLLTDVQTEVTEDALWHFEVNLKPGDYTLIAYAGPPPEDGGIQYSSPVIVTVEKKEFTELVLSFRPS